MLSRKILHVELVEHLSGTFLYVKYVFISEVAAEKIRIEAHAECSNNFDYNLITSIIILINDIFMYTSFTGI